MRRKLNQKIILGAIVMALTVPQIVEATGFTDVPTNKWYYQDIKRVKEKGIINGYEDKTYKPESTITRVEALKIIVEGKTGGDIPIVESQIKWYTKYINYGRAVGLEVDDIEKMSGPITREEVAEYIVKVNEKEIKEVQGILADSESEYIERLYTDGIMQGVGKQEGKILVNPKANLTRAEMAALINRVLDPEEPGEVAEPKDIVQEEKHKMPRHIMANKVEQPRTQEEFVAEFFDMIAKREFKRTISYDYTGGAINNESTEIEAAFTEAYSKYPEYMAYTNVLNIGTKIKGAGKEIIITIKANGRNQGDASKEDMLNVFESKAQEVLRELKKQKKITEKQTELEKARAVYTWVVQNTKYMDSGYGEAFTGYGQITSGEAVCQGYVATYNYLLRELGIEVEGVSGNASSGGTTEKHIWTAAILDGRRVLIDPTFGDPTPDRGLEVDYKYFDVTEDYLRQTHSW